MAQITQTSALRLLNEIWANSPEYSVNNTRGFTKSIWDTGSTYIGTGYKVHIPIIQTVAAQAYSGSVSYTANVETEVTITPTVAYSAVQIQEDVSLTAFVDPVKGYGPALAEGLYQKPDIDGLGKYASFTSNIVAEADFTLPGMQELVSEILSNGGDKVMLGQLDGWYHPIKWNDVMDFADAYSAQVRGENKSSAVTGNLGMVFGVNMNFSGNVITSTTLKNLIVSKKSMVLVRKNLPKLEMERTDLTTKVVASMMYGIEVLHQATGGLHDITALT